MSLKNISGEIRAAEAKSYKEWEAASAAYKGS